jgi:ABC-type transporter Mla MlaB component
MDHHLIIDSVTHNNADNICKQGKEILQQYQTLHIDLSNIHQFDSSVFAVILEWRRLCNQHRYTLHLQLSDKLEKLADVYDIKNILI